MIRLDNTPFAPLAAHLLDIVKAVSDKNISVILVGGFGMILRREQVRVTGERTVYGGAASARATEDFDILLKLDLLADIEKMRQLRSALDGLGYSVVTGAEKYQFVKKGTGDATRRDVKVDLLARRPEAGDPPVIEGERRVMSRSRNNPLHAYTTPEAIAAEDKLQEVTVSGRWAAPSS